MKYIDKGESKILQIQLLGLKRQSSTIAEVQRHFSKPFSTAWILKYKCLPLLSWELKQQIGNS